MVLLLSCCRGQTPSQLAKCFSVGKRLTSTPISARMTSAVPTSIPSIWVRSTPSALNSGPQASKFRSLGLRPQRRGYGVNGLSPARLGSLANSAWMMRSHSVICW